MDEQHCFQILSPHFFKIKKKEKIARNAPVLKLQRGAVLQFCDKIVLGPVRGTGEKVILKKAKKENYNHQVLKMYTLELF